MRIQLVPGDSEACHAGAKAPRDAAAVAERMGFRRLAVRRPRPPVPALSGLFLLLWMGKALWCGLRVPRGSLVFLQFAPTLFTGRLSVRMLSLLRRLRRVRFITLVHDAEPLRAGGAAHGRVGFDRRLRQFASVSDILIVHNAAMRTWFEENGVAPSRLVELGLFDYLVPSPADASRAAPSGEIVVAGNLAAEKAAYLSGLGTIPNVRWKLYGPCCDGSPAAGGNVVSCGCRTPEELPSVLKGDFGLVWDGDSVETCGGPFGAYLRYNSPHKLSLYLACGLPVIVWSDSAQAAFVRANRLGLCVESLRELPGALAELDADAYARMRRNVRLLSDRVRSGSFLEAALGEATERLAGGAS